MYDGEWRNGLRNGRGKCSYWNRGVYEGKWINDVRAGLGQVRATPKQVLNKYLFEYK